jgi:ketosteroid isomerase-like protein
MQTPEQVVQAFHAAWAPGDGDIPRAMGYVAEDAVYILYLSNELLPFAGETSGRAAIEASLREIRRQFEYLLYRPFNIAVEGDVVRMRVEHIYRHRASGELLSGNFRIVFTVRDGKICRAEEYHDRAKVEAFMRLFSTR